MNDIEYGEHIGFPLKNLNTYGDLTGQHPVFQLKLKSIKDFYGLSYDEISIYSEKDDTINLISILLMNIINRSFFDNMIKKYGNPDVIAVEDELLKESKNENLDEFKQNIIKREFAMKTVSFQDNPTLIIWKKQDFQINIRLHHEYNATRIIFKKPSKFNTQP
ncbi:hypothetical protein [Winogradskyella immobilis]|uniref:Uncharacterized protein n=1 Tax=Winogradskyella immobilis TaxID=2816852 RepID=A0ABS8ER82_9FLAO|nr:hypothetical protein [Winogradskyella immobilis]MCC1485526.1 hypothetical protein [Winogradskyella immobilis]MCG0017618.1 hypothetical protein [Winogradskyella immobilis]